jgi:glyoxylase-like metal-dependent hydrolase (beta-lactamase superfamily II)
MLIIPISAWVAATNAYVVAEGPGSLALVVDAPPEPELIGSVLADHDLSVAALLLTHGHVDHSGGAGYLESHTGADVYVHPDDDFLTLHPEVQLSAMFGMTPPGSYELPARFRPLAGDETLEIGSLEVEVRHTPGHTPGHCCFYLESEGTLFSGDQLFAGSIGRFDLPGGDGTALARSMAEQVMNLDDDVRVLPGHGPETSIGRERATNPFRDMWS